MHSDILDKLTATFPPAAAEVIRAGATRRIYPRKSIIYHQDAPTDGIHLMAAGCVMLEWISASGDVVGYRVATRGDFVGHRSYFAEEPRSATARTVTDTETLFIAGKTLKHAIEADPRVCCQFAREVGRDAGPQLSRVLRNHKIPSLARLAYMLDHLSRKLARRTVNGEGKRDLDGWTPFPLTQQDLAHLLDIRNETVSRLIREMEERGILYFENRPRRVAIPNREGITALFREYV